MARVTVEDCLGQVENRFELVLLASKRARHIHAGSSPMVPKGQDKETVVALREIAEGHINADYLKRGPGAIKAEASELFVNLAATEEVQAESTEKVADKNAEETTANDTEASISSDDRAENTSNNETTE